MSYTYEALSPGGHQEMLEEVFSKSRAVGRASGAIASFSDGADLPLSEFAIDVDPVQDLHGYDAPWVGGAGKNKAEPVENTWSNKGITATKNDDGSYSITGTATENVTSNFLINVYPVSAGEEYIVTNKKNQTDTATKYTRCVCSFYNDSTYKSEINVNEGQTITVPSNANRIRLSYVWNNGFVVPAGAIIYPMVRLATETDPTFAPYSNICPISGHTGVDAWVRGKNLANPATVTTLYPTGASGTYPNQIRSSSNARSVIAEVTPNTTYTISKKTGQRFRLAFTAEEPANGVDDYGYTWNDTGTTITVTSPSNAKYMVVLFWSSNVDTDTEEDMLATLQIELGETATTYEPYVGSEIDITFPTEAGEVYGAKLDILSGILTVDRVGVTYSDTNKKRNDGSFRLYPAPSNALVTNVDNEQPSPLFICNKFKFMSIFEVITTSAVNVGIGISKTSSGFYIKDTAMLQMTLEEAKTYLSSHPIDVVYPLATPITYHLTPHQVNSLLGHNNVWANTGNTTVAYTKGLYNDISAKRAEVARTADSVDWENVEDKPEFGSASLKDYTATLDPESTDVVTSGAVAMELSSYKTLTGGSVVSFTDGADLPMPSFICNIDAVQDLHGQDHPWVGGAGKNKFPILIGDDVWVGNHGATYTSSNGVLIIESLAPTNTSSGVYSSSNSKMRELLATLDGEYVYSFEIKCNKEASITCGISSHGNIARTVSTNWVRYEIPTTFSIGENVGCVFYNYSKTENLEIQVRNFMIQQGTTATPYEPYSNICPISGHTGVDAVISPTTEASAGTTYSVSWQTEAGEVFGGYVDLVSGVLTVTHGIVNCKNLYFVPSASAGGLNYADISISVGNTPISNKLKSVEKNIGWASTAFCVSVNNDNKVRVYGRLSDFEDGGTYENTMVRYELATPITYQLTPTQIKSLLGNNNAWCNTGDIKSLQYQPNNIIAELRSEILALQARVEELEEEIPQQTEQTE